MLEKFGITAAHMAKTELHDNERQRVEVVAIS